MLGFSINIPAHLRNTYGDLALPGGHPTRCGAHRGCLLPPGPAPRVGGQRQVLPEPISEPCRCFYLRLSEKSAFPQQRKTYSIVGEGEKPIIFPPIHSARCLCRDLLRVAEDILLYITQMQLNSMGEGEGHRVQAPAFSVFLLIYWVTRGRQLCAAISSPENGDVGHSALRNRHEIPGCPAPRGKENYYYYG